MAEDVLQASLTPEELELEALTRRAMEAMDVPVETILAGLPEAGRACFVQVYGEVFARKIEQEMARLRAEE